MPLKIAAGLGPGAGLGEKLREAREGKECGRHRHRPPHLLHTAAQLQTHSNSD